MPVDQASWSANAISHPIFSHFRIAAVRQPYLFRDLLPGRTVHRSRHFSILRCQQHPSTQLHHAFTRAGEASCQMQTICSLEKNFQQNNKQLPECFWQIVRQQQTPATLPTILGIFGINSKNKIHAANWCRIHKWQCNIN